MKACKRWLECPLLGRCPLPQWLGSSKDLLMLSSPDPSLDLELPLLRLDLVEGRISAWSGWGVSMSISLYFHIPLWAENTLTSMAVRSTGAQHHYLTEIHRHQLNQLTQGFIFVFCILSFVKSNIYYLSRLSTKIPFAAKKNVSQVDSQQYCYLFVCVWICWIKLGRVC